MNAAGSMSSASWRENSLVPGLVPGKKGGEIALPKCVHFDVSRSSTECGLEGQHGSELKAPCCSNRYLAGL